MEQLIYWNDKYKIDPVHLENKDTDPNIDFENINQSFNSTSSSKENDEQKNEDNSSTQRSTSTFKMNPFANEMKFISQNVRSLKSKAQAINLDTIINTMEVNNISAYCIQETWLDGNFIKERNGYTFFHHGLAKQTCKRGQKGVGVILSPELTKYYKGTGSIPSVIPKNENSMELGRFIGIKLKFDNM